MSMIGMAEILLILGILGGGVGDLRVPPPVQGKLPDNATEPNRRDLDPGG